MTGVLLDDDPVAPELAAAPTLGAVAALVRRWVRGRLQCDGVTFVLRDGDECFYADEDSIAPLWAGQRFPLAHCISGWAMLHDEQAVIDDISSDARIPQEAYRSTFVRSLVMTPVSGRHGNAAAIGAYWAETGRAGQSDTERLRRVAEATATAVENIGLADAPWAPNFARQ